METHSTKTPVAIVGMACRLPQANDLDQFWRILLDGRSTADELPASRLNRELHYSPEKGTLCKTYTTLGCLVDYEAVDASRVPLTQKEIDDSDISHTTMAAVAAEACRHAGYDPFQMPASFHRAGVYIGHVKGSERGGDLTYSSLIEQTAQYIRDIEGVDSMLGEDPSGLIREIIQTARDETPHRTREHNPDLNGSQCAALISNMLKLDGPFMVINSACASSLQAIGAAVRQIQLGHVEAALVGGAAYCKFDSMVMFSQAHSVSANGTRPFDEDADGLISGEGYVAFLMKPLEKALTDGDQVHAVIRSIGISCDGRGKSLWAPKKEGQVAAMQRAYGDGLDVKRLQYVEAHATSTQVGDQTEVQSLADALRGRLPEGTKIPIGSVKGNIGHTIETAGAAGLLKTILAMKHGVVPPTANINKLNSSIDWDNAPLWVPREPIDWPEFEDGHPRRAAVNSFGIGGLNVHLVVDQAATEAEMRAAVAKPVRAEPPAEPRVEPVAIVGVGGVYPGAREAAAFFAALESGADRKSPLPDDRWIANIPAASRAATDAPPTPPGGFITDFEYDWRAHKVPPKQVAAADPLQFMLLDAVDQAIKNAGYDEREFDRARTGVCVGAITSGEFHEHLQMGLRLPEFQQTLAAALRKRGVDEAQIDSATKQYAKALLKRMPAITDETGSYTSNTLVSRITKTWDLMGGGAAIDAGGASGAATLATCIDLLQTRECNLMVCAAGQRSMGYCIYQRFFYRNQLADPNNPAAGGLTPGEGVGVLLLKRLADAERDGDQVLGVIRGVGVSSKADFAEAVATAIERSHQQAGVTAEDISYVEAAAFGLADIDRRELEGLDRAFHGRGHSDPVNVGALGGQIGFLGSGAATAAILRTAHALNKVEAFANVQSESLQAAASTNRHLQVSKQSVAMPARTDDGRLFAGVNATCFDQLAYHIVMQRPQNVAPRETRAPFSPRTAALTAAPDAARDPLTIVRLSGESIDQLRGRARDALQSVETVFAAARSDRFGADPMRMAIVCESAEELQQKLQLVERMLGKENVQPILEEKGIYCQRPFQSPKIALCFPGHGSQYAGMLEPLTESFPAAHAVLERMELALSQLNYPSFRDVAWSDDGALGVDVWRTQLALLCADAISLEAWRTLGVEADAALGHSFGEFPALLASGAWDFTTAVRATRARCDAIESSTSGGVMMSVAAEPTVLDQFDPNWSHVLTISVRNAQDQFVVGGEDSDVRRFQAWLNGAGVQSRILPTPRAFHTPLMKSAKPAFAESLRQLAIVPPRLPMLSSVTNRYVAEPDDIRANLVNQLTDPVNYAGLLARLRSEAFNVFVEVGPHQILTKLHRRTLPSNVAAIGVDAPKRNPLRQLANLRAVLDCAGVFDAAPSDSIAVAAPTGTPQSAPGADSPPAKPAAAIPSRPHEPMLPSGINNRLSLIRLTGSPYEMGLQHGRDQAAPIRKLIRRYADLAGQEGKLPDLTPQIDDLDQFFGDEEWEEMRGVADGAGVHLNNIVAHNLMLYPDSGAGCAHFALTEASNPSIGMLHATNEDQPLALSVRERLARCIQLRCPSNGIPHIVFSVVGQVAGINGMNAAGLAVSSAMLLDVPRRSNAGHGLTQPAIVSRMLGQAHDVETAVEIAREHCAAGGWSMCISSHAIDELTYAEYDGRSLQVRPGQFKVLAANHCMLHQGSVEPPSHSELRLSRLEHLFGNGRTVSVSVEKAQQALRDRFDMQRGREARFPTMNTVRRVDNQLSVVMHPAKGKVWIADPSTCQTEADRFVELDVAELFKQFDGIAEVTPVKSADVKVLHGDLARQALKQRGVAPQVNNDSVCYRYALRLVESTIEACEPPPLANRSALVVGDNAAASALANRLHSSGCRVVRLSDLGDPAAATACLDDAWRDGSIQDVFHLAAFDAPQTPRRSINVSFQLLQRWVQLRLEDDGLDDARVFAATRLGGDFGLHGRIQDCSGGAISGLMKSLAIELGMKTEGRFRARAVDFDEAAAPADVAEAFLRELQGREREPEVGYVDGRRYVVRPVAQIAEPLNGENVKSPQGAWIVTGGARGVTAVVAREMAKRFPIKLHLVGSSPLPQIDPAWLGFSAEQKRQLRGQVMKQAVAEKKVPAAEWSRVERSIEMERNLRQLRADGVEFQYHACDVSDRDAVAKLLQTVHGQDGPIRGVIHGAGFESALRFEKKKPELVEKTFSVKVDGAANLLSQLEDDPLDYFIAFGSVSGRFGGIGQSDYAAANDMLSKLVASHRARRPDCRSVTFHWHAWDEVGMAVRPESSHLRDFGNVTYMPTCEGVQHVFSEISAGVPEAEIVITGWPFHKLDPKYAAKVAGQSKKKATKSEPPAPAMRVELPLVDRVADRQAGSRIVCELELDPVRDAFLAEHRFKGRPLTPGVIAMEAMMEAAECYGAPETHAVVLRDVQLLEPQRFHGDEIQRTTVECAAEGDLLRCEVMSDFVNRKGKLLKKDRVLQRGVVELASERQAIPGRIPSPPTDCDWRDFVYRDDLVIQHGPSLQSLQQIAVRGPFAWGRLEALDPQHLSRHRRGDWLLPCAAIDAAFYCCGVQARSQVSGVALIPKGLQRLRCTRMPTVGERLTAWVVCNEMDSERACFDFCIVGESGESLLAAHGYEGVFIPQTAPAAIQ